MLVIVLALIMAAVVPPTIAFIQAGKAQIKNKTREIGVVAIFQYYGLPVVKRIKEDLKLPCVPVIAFGALAGGNDQDSALSMAAGDALVKPASAASFRRVVA